MQQVKLKQNDTYMITWVDKPVKRGNIVELKDDQSLWNVVDTYLHKDKNEINRKWNVGGIDHPIV